MTLVKVALPVGMLQGVDGDEWAALDDNGDGDDDDDYLDGQYDLDAQAYAGDAWM